MAVYVKPLLFTSTGPDVFMKAVLINQGIPKQSISNTLDPTMLDIAISPFPVNEEIQISLCNCIVLYKIAKLFWRNRLSALSLSQSTLFRFFIELYS